MPAQERKQPISTSYPGISRAHSTRAPRPKSRISGSHSQEARPSARRGCSRRRKAKATAERARNRKEKAIRGMAPVAASSAVTAGAASRYQAVSAYPAGTASTRFSVTSRNQASPVASPLYPPSRANTVTLLWLFPVRPYRRTSSHSPWESYTQSEYR